MKSKQIHVLLNVLEGVFIDATLAFPGLKESFLKDYERVALYCQSRGLGVFTLDLPSLDALLLRGLEAGRLSLEGSFCKRVSNRIHVPRLFSGLWLRIFDKDSCLKQDVDVNAVMFLRQLCRLGAKLQVACSPDRIQAALENYHDIEKSLRAPTTKWDSDSLDEAVVHSLDLSDLGSNTACVDGLYGSTTDNEATTTRQLQFCLEERAPQPSMRDLNELRLCQRVADTIVRNLGNYDPLFHSWRREESGRGIGFKHGSGAVADRTKNWDKSRFYNWPRKLENRFRFGTSAVCWGDDRGRPLNRELPSRLICVPKSAKAPRLIASEPTEHQWCQQNLWSWLEDQSRRLFKGSFIDFRNQKASSDLVLKSSLDRKLVTVDLSDASDRLSCWTVERMFRSNFSVLSALHAARTRWLRDDISSQSSFIKLKKFASQGTATTFPVQSLVFLIIALSSTLGDEEPTMENIWKYRDQVRVYGDDIIIPRHGYARLIRLMNLLQLKVNVAKSYANGEFRESCGVHGFRGHDVTPVMPKTIVADGPASVVAVVDTTNNLFYKGYWNASHRLWNTIPPRFRRGLRIVGPADAGFFGLASYSGSCESHLKSRWNSGLHRYEVRTFRLSERTDKRDRGGFVSLLDFFTRPHNPSVARTVSVYGRSRRANLALVWESATCSSHDGHGLLPITTRISQ